MWLMLRHPVRIGTRVPWLLILGLAAASLQGLLMYRMLEDVSARSASELATSISTPQAQLRSPTLDSPRRGTPVPTLGAATVAVCADKDDPGYGLIDSCTPASTYPLAAGD
jgi:hypothetical protein